MFLSTNDITLRPVIGIFVESELWPNLIDAVHARGAQDTSPTIVLNTFAAFRSFSFTF